ncbi:hypothetical protein ACFYW8_40465 [Streptomyces sp. NPDC002742]|uniref:hypothetical protein n=1 Tax=Streptomyces sp. NPDC002742 TaxID=3364663 RepID=UPI0036B24F0C
MIEPLVPDGLWEINGQRQWLAGDMSGEHMELIDRWLRGEVMDGKVGIKVQGGPFHGRTRIVVLDESGQPPPRQRGRGSGGHAPTDMWHVHEHTPSLGTTAGWSYDYAGTEPCNDTR